MPARERERNEGIRGRLHRGLAIKSFLGILVKIALLGAIAYGLWTWYGQQGSSGSSTVYAERECIDAINSRYDVTGVNVFEVAENPKGFVVRASGARQDGTRVRIICLTNSNGSVRDITLEHR